ncbi:MAG: TOBE-like domain-containing protein [Planctomycetota bacterium]|nr:TOBE-like domain-containing protein [Planctomycetota bacterium]
MSIEIHNISKSFGSFTALQDISLKIEHGELVSLLGPSGSGKTTLLRVIAGMESPDPAPNSHVYFFGEDVANKPVGDRKVGFVFQHYALFKHMSVFENIAFGLRVRPRSQRPSESAIRDKVHSLLNLIQLEGFGTRFPKQLSGGQRQRVALARALAIEPQVLLLDEPFGALDAKVRKGLRDWLRGLHDELNTTTILVTHDQEEALEVSDRVVVMNQARIEQVGAPAEVFHHPASEFVIDFLGNVNVFHGRVNQGQAVLDNMRVNLSNPAIRDEAQAKVYVRPNEMSIDRSPIDSTSMPARVARINRAGVVAKISLESKNKEEIRVDVSMEQLLELQLQLGDEVFVHPNHARVFVPDYTI